jgi:PAS domain S-box-containing protein
MHFRELLEEDLKSGNYGEAVGREQDWLDERMAMRARGEGFREQDVRDGRWLRVADRRTSDGGTVSICIDITEVKRNEGSFKLLFDSNPVPMWLWEGVKDLPVLDLNQAALTHLGYSKDDISRLSVFDLLAAEEAPALRAMLASGIYKPYYGERVWRPRCKDGTLRSALPYIHALPRSAGERKFVGAIVDVTERIAAEDERRNNETLAKALDQAKEADRIKSEFLAVMSHELRTPLNAILGFSEVLKDQIFGPIGSQRYREYANDIYNSGSHLLSLINDILDISKLDAGQLELYLEPVKIGDLIVDCVHSVEALAAKSNIRVRIDAASHPHLLHADERRLRQMLLNLLSNAIKFTEMNGEVRISALPSVNGFAIVVSDTGIGIEPENIAKALDRFGQIDSSLSRKYQGTGLGLPLTKHLAELHGATLEIESQVNVGTTVTILFPQKSVLAERDTA